MPDFLALDGSPSLIETSDIKLWHRGNRFAAQIMSDSNLSNNWIKLRPWESDLTEGVYKLSVTMWSYAGPVSDTITIYIQDTPDKVLSRFSPASHFKKVMDAKGENRLYIDAFPGVMDAKYFIPDWPADVSGFIEMPKRWHYADAQEYRAGNIKFHVYNIADHTATYNVELGQMQYDNRVDDGIKSIVRYDIGEPNFMTQYGMPIEGNLIEFRDGRTDALDLTRIDICDKPQITNKIDFSNLPNELSAFQTSFEEPVEIKGGQSVAINGAVAPIQIDRIDIKYDENLCWYKLYNRIARVNFVFKTEDGMAIFSDEIPISLDRTGGEYGNKTANSLYEFRYVLPEKVLDNFRNQTIRVEVAAKDTYGKFVKGTGEKFSFIVY